jgi:hypothetical protein
MFQNPDFALNFSGPVPKKITWSKHKTTLQKFRAAKFLSSFWLVPGMPAGRRND